MEPQRIDDIRARLKEYEWWLDTTKTQHANSVSMLSAMDGFKTVRAVLEAHAPADIAALLALVDDLQAQLSQARAKYERTVDQAVMLPLWARDDHDDYGQPECCPNPDREKDKEAD